MKIAWNENYSVDNKELDHQHKKLFEMLDNFQTETLANPQNIKAFQNLFSGLKDYTVSHFQTEEKFMEKIKFPYLALHQSKHKQFIDKLKDYELRVKNGLTLLPTELVTFIKEWLERHIYVEDKMYARHHAESAKAKE